MLGCAETKHFRGREWKNKGRKIEGFNVLREVFATQSEKIRNYREISRN